MRTIAIEEALWLHRAGYKVLYMNNPIYKGLPYDYTPLPKKHKFDPAGYKYSTDVPVDTYTKLKEEAWEIMRASVSRSASEETP